MVMMAEKQKNKKNTFQKAKHVLGKRGNVHGGHL
jgi:hypothetical protein